GGGVVPVWALGEMSSKPSPATDTAPPQSRDGAFVMETTAASIRPVRWKGGVDRADASGDTEVRMQPRDIGETAHREPAAAKIPPPLPTRPMQASELSPSSLRPSKLNVSIPGLLET